MAALGAAFALSLAALAGLRSPAGAQGYPSHNITIVVPLGAGTGMDIVVRLYADKLAQVLGKAVVVENKPGAATMLAATQVANAQPDGHTLVVLTQLGARHQPASLQADQLQPGE